MDYDDLQVDLVMEVEIINDTSEEELLEQDVSPSSSSSPSPILQIENNEPNFLQFDENSENRTPSPICSASSSNQDPPIKVESPAKRRKVSSDDEDGALCPICLDNWMSTGEHRVCALRCGHLFGYKCITRWIFSNKSCPSCKMKASSSDIRYIYANKLIAMDATELELVKKKLNSVIEEKNRIKVDLTKAICKEHTLLQEIENYKKKIKNLSITSSSSHTNSSTKPVLKLSNSSLVCQQGTCRVMDINSQIGKFAISLKSNNNLFPGFGIKKCSTDNLAIVEYTPLHSKVIRDLKFNHSSSYLLSVSLDKSIKISDLNSNSTISTYTFDSMLWSCCWDESNQNLFYVGSQQGATTKFDLRNMSEPVKSTKVTGDWSPVVSLVSIPSCPGGLMPLGGFITCKLNSMWCYENMGGSVYRKQQIPIEGPFISMSYNKDINQVLISARPNSRVPNSRHFVCNFERLPNEENFKFNTLYTFYGGQLQKQLSRSRFLQHAGYTYVTAQVNNTISLWNVNNGSNSSVLTNNSILDLMPLKNCNDSYLLALSEKKLDFYKFQNCT